VSSEASAAPLAHTPLYEEHKKLKGRLVPFAGYELPVQYSGVSAEHKAVRSAAGLFDVSHMGELWLTGPGAAKTVNRLITNDTARLVDGQALYTCCCNEEGRVLDDLIIYRARSEPAGERWLVVCNASNRSKISAHFSKAASECTAAGARCDFDDASDRTALLALQGPRALEIAAALGDDGPSLGELSAFHFREAKLAGIACTAARTGYTGEDGLELFCASESATALWAAICARGKDKGLLPAGLGARDTLRLEARLSLYGNEIDETTNPLEAGLGWVVKLGKDDFVGKGALAAIKETGLARRLVGFEMVGKGIARHGYALHDSDAPDGAAVGICTSGSPGPTVGKNIGLGYVPIAMASVGSRLYVDCRGRRIEAVVVKTPFYKRPG